jgi:hypothetical protein
VRVNEPVPDLDGHVRAADGGSSHAVRRCYDFRAGRPAAGLRGSDGLVVSIRASGCSADHVRLWEGAQLCPERHVSLRTFPTPERSLQGLTHVLRCGVGVQVRDHDVRRVLRSIADCIQHSPSSEQRAESCAALVTVYSSARYRSNVTEAQALQEVVLPTLVQALGDESPAVTQASSQALGAVRARSQEAMQAAVEQLPGDLQRILKAKLDDGDDGLAVGVDDEVCRDEDLSHRETGGAILEGSEVREVAGGEDGGSAGVGEMRLSFVPARLLAELQDANNWRVRALAVEELQQLVQKVQTQEEMLPHMSQLMDVLLALLHDANFKIEITALQTIGDLVSLMGTCMREYAEVLLPQLKHKMQDNKTLVRHANAKVLIAPAFLLVCVRSRGLPCPLLCCHVLAHVRLDPWLVS